MLHLTRHHPDIGGVTAVVDEPIVAEAVLQPPDEHDIVLQAQIRAATSAPAAPSTAMPGADCGGSTSILTMVRLRCRVGAVGLWL